MPEHEQNRMTKPLEAKAPKKGREKGSPDLLPLRAYTNLYWYCLKTSYSRLSELWRGLKKLFKTASDKVCINSSIQEKQVSANSARCEIASGKFAFKTAKLYWFVVVVCFFLSFFPPLSLFFLSVCLTDCLSFFLWNKNRIVEPEKGRQRQSWNDNILYYNLF